MDSCQIDFLLVYNALLWYQNFDNGILKIKVQGEFMAKDSNGNILNDGDSVTVIKDLKVKGTSATLKRGTLIKNIRLSDNEDEIECNADKIKGLVLKTCFLKKV